MGWKKVVLLTVTVLWVSVVGLAYGVSYHPVLVQRAFLKCRAPARWISPTHVKIHHFFYRKYVWSPK